MSYRTGDLTTIVPCRHKKTEYGGCAEYLCDTVMDSRGDDMKTLTGGVYLPHSCDSWVIGGPEEIKTLIADLQTVLESLK